MSDSSTDFHQQKTDDELLFFVNNPEHYHPSLVEQARRDLRRRGVLAAPEPALFVPSDEAEALARPRPWVWAVIFGLIAAVAGGSLYGLTQRNAARGVAIREATADRLKRNPPRLTEVATSVIPDFGPAVVRCVQQQVQRVPAAERATAAKASLPMHQYRELTKRFWTAEVQTEYVTEQVRQGKTSPALPGHVEVALASWQQWNKALAYGYKFGPTMANHLDVMTRMARQQQEALADVLLVANNPQPFENEKTKQRDADMNDLLSGLLAKSPVTGRPYLGLVLDANRMK